MKKIKSILFYVALTVCAVIFVYPFYWMVIASIAPENEIGSLTLMPTSLTLTSYAQMVDKIPIGGAFINSIIVASSITIG
ncbi:MAG: sugar ABC transporter permease, partial [Ignavibacteria bacterium CG_4_8_14_3_um_filter_37_9]